jgi:hypothetical protein
MQSRDQKKLKSKVNEVVRPYCKSEWCLLKEITCSSHDEAWIRNLLQLKCLEIFKLEQSEIDGVDIGWQETHLRWVANGWAKAFADSYQESKTAEQIYSEIKLELSKRSDAPSHK